MAKDDTLISELIDTYGEEISSSDVRAFAGMKGLAYSTLTSKLTNYKSGRGTWNLQVSTESVDTIESSYSAPSASVSVADVIPSRDNLIPAKDSNYVPFGCYKEVKKIISSGMFYPVFITGLSGNGKTLAVEQACANLKREMIRFNVTIETDSDDLIGGFRLEDGTTKWHDGPVVEAMEKGAVLLLDECLDENEEIMVGTLEDHKPMKLADMDFNVEYPVLSFNMETGEVENDTGMIISDKTDDIYLVELEDGRTIRLNSKHPFIIQNEDGTFAEKSLDDGLSVGDYVVLINGTAKIKSIATITSGKVRNLMVVKNHTFINSHGIVTHNCDLASNKIMVIQSVLEGKPLFLKKIGKIVKPKEGFNIIATANTKGKGSSDGRFIGTNVLNEAFLERFSITLEQPYPTESYETKILTKHAKSLDIDPNEVTDFIKRLVRWSDTTRKTFLDGGIDELISTRRLVHVLKAYSIFKNKATAVKLCVSRFDDEVKSAFISTYDKIDATFKTEEDLEKKQNELEEETDDVKKNPDRAAGTDGSSGASIGPMVQSAINAAKIITPINHIISSTPSGSMTYNLADATISYSSHTMNTSANT